jgi:hypothetical protein
MRPQFTPAQSRTPTAVGLLKHKVLIRAPYAVTVLLAVSIIETVLEKRFAT